jgi:hypothetical protein
MHDLHRKSLHAAVLLIASLPILAKAQETSLRFDSLPPTKGTSVGFTVAPSGSVSIDTLFGLPIRDAETQDHKYVLTVDTGTFRRDKYSRFSFDAYVRPAPPKKQSNFQKYKVSEDPVGAFSDDTLLVTFHISGSSGQDVGTIRLPVHSDDGSDNVTIAIPSTPQKVSFSGLSTMELGLTNNLESLHLNVAEVNISSTLCQPCWLPPMSAKPNINSLAPKKGTSLIVLVRPNMIKALGKSLFSLNPNTAHDSLLISVFSVAEQGGLVTSQEFKISVRFAPPLLYLLLAVLVGALVGGLVRLAMRPAPYNTAMGSSRTGREIFIAIVMAVAAWIFSIALFSYAETRITLLGFSLDPSQVIPAGLIAFLSAGGPQVVARIKGAFKK